MPKSRINHTPGTYTAGFASCTCGWFVSRATVDQAAQAASVHDLLEHSVRPPAKVIW